MIIKAYTYNTEQEAQVAIQAINEAMGIPKPNSTTVTYTYYEEQNGVFFIRYLTELKHILGEPTDFEYIEPTIEI